MEIIDFIAGKIEESRLRITHMEGDLQIALERKKNMELDIEHIRDQILEKQSEALFRPQKLEESVLLDQLMEENTSLDKIILDLKKQLIHEKDQLGLFQKTLNYVRESERQNKDKLVSKNEINDVLSDSVDSGHDSISISNQLQGLKRSLVFAKKICLSDTRRCMLEIDKMNFQVDQILKNYP